MNLLLHNCQISSSHPSRSFQRPQIISNRALSFLQFKKVVEWSLGGDWVGVTGEWRVKGDRKEEDDEDGMGDGPLYSWRF
jgi:hypothetical protein